MRANDDYLNYEKTITREQKKILEDTIDRYFAQHATAQPLTPNSAHALPGGTIVSYNCAGGYDGRAQPSVLCVYGMPPAMMHARVGCNSHSTALCGHAGAPWHGGACGAPVHAAAGLHVGTVPHRPRRIFREIGAYVRAGARRPGGDHQRARRCAGLHVGTIPHRPRRIFRK